MVSEQAREFIGYLQRAYDTDQYARHLGREEMNYDLLIHPYLSRIDTDGVEVLTKIAHEYKKCLQILHRLRKKYRSGLDKINEMIENKQHE